MGNHVGIFLVSTGAALASAAGNPLIASLGAGAFSSSSQYDSTYCADEAARYGTLEGGKPSCWCAQAGDCLSGNEFLNVNLGANYNVYEVATKGCEDWNEHIRSYKLEYYYEGTWSWYSGNVLTGNSDANPTQEAKTTLGANGIVASRLRIWPQDQQGHCSTQFEAYGSPTPPPTQQPTTDEPTTRPPTTARPTTASPTTDEPTTASPTSDTPTTAAPTTNEPTTGRPTTDAPTTDAPTSRPTSSPTESDNEGQVDEDDQGEDDDDQGEELNADAEEAEPATDGGGGKGMAIAGISNVELLILATSMVVVCLLCVVGMCVIMRMDRRKKAKLQEVFGEEEVAIENQR